jgi:hypothetical protein
MDSIADKIFEGESPGTHFGYNISAGGVINNDGFCDVLIGAEHKKEGPDYVESIGPGSAYLYYGGRDMDTTYDKVFRGELARDRFGNEVEICDVDNDGFSDVIIGAPHSRTGSVYLYWGATDMDEEADWIVTGERPVYGFGDNLKFADFNNDTFLDLLVGAYSTPNGSLCGRCLIYYGGTGRSIDKEVDYIFYGESDHEGRFGSYLATGDINGDKYEDVVVSAWGYDNVRGRIYLYYGPFNNKTDITLNWDTTNASIGTHTLKVEIPPVEGEQNTEDNIKTITIEVVEPTE